MLRLVDTSVWVEFLHKGGSRVCQETVGRLLSDREAAYCGLVELELLAGARTAREEEYVRLVLESGHRFDMPEPLWAVAGHAQFQLCRQGKRVGLGDLVIATVARAHQAVVVTRDADFESIRDSVWPELKVEKMP